MLRFVTGVRTWPFLLERIKILGGYITLSIPRIDQKAHYDKIT